MGPLLVTMASAQRGRGWILAKINFLISSKTIKNNHPPMPHSKWRQAILASACLIDSYCKYNDALSGCAGLSNLLQDLILHRRAVVEPGVQFILDKGLINLGSREGSLESEARRYSLTSLYEFTVR